MRRIRLGIQPVNELDMTAQQHDLDYLIAGRDSVARDRADDRAIIEMYSNQETPILGKIGAVSLYFNKFLRKFDLDFGK